jgi:hypothetical protein
MPRSPVFPNDLAEAVRFELTGPCEPPVFKTGAIDHSATLPWKRILEVRLGVVAPNTDLV